MVVDVFKAAERLMAMGEDDWRRHANPWSVATRIPILPAIVLVWWFRDLLGWGVWPLTLALIFWAYWNPRAFAVPSRFDNWAAHGTFGERVFLDRATWPVPRHHIRWAHGLTVVTALGLPPLVWGIWQFEPWASLFGLTLCLGSKIWFVDRMVWLFRDMARGHPDLAAWAQPDAPNRAS